MSDEGNSSGSDAETASAPRAGARLKAAREERGQPLDAIARELNLDADKLVELESNRFERLGAAVFIRGYLRKYASLVGVPEAAILAEFESLYDSADAPPVVLRRREPRRSLPGPQVFAVAALVLLVAAVAWWAFSGSVLQPRAPETTATPPPPASVPAAASRAPGVQTGADTGAGREEPPAKTSLPEEEVAAAPIPAPAAAEPAPEPAVRSVTLVFSDECWFELSDGDGRRLFSGTGRAGQSRRFSGAPPLSLVLGNAAAVSIEVDGEPWRVDPADRRGRTARITIPAT